MKNEVYKLNFLEKFVNWIIHNIFYYRLLFVLVSVVAIIIFTIFASPNWPIASRYKNILTVLTFGSIIIGIFYSIINYEHTHRKAKDDIKLTKSAMAFTISLDWHKKEMVENQKIIKKLYDDNRTLILADKASEFNSILECDPISYSALISIFNYLETILLESIMIFWMKGLLKIVLVDVY